jgi:hypothetical protein
MKEKLSWGLELMLTNGPISRNAAEGFRVGGILQKSGRDFIVEPLRICGNVRYEKYAIS